MLQQHTATNRRRHQILTVGLTTLCLLVSSCAGGGAAGSGTETASRYPSAVRDNFLNGCSSASGGKASACACALAEIEATFSLEEFIELDRRAAASGSTDPAIEAILLRCA